MTRQLGKDTLGRQFQTIPKKFPASFDWSFYDQERLGIANYKHPNFLSLFLLRLWNIEIQQNT